LSISGFRVINNESENNPVHDILFEAEADRKKRTRVGARFCPPSEAFPITPLAFKREKKLGKSFIRRAENHSGSPEKGSVIVFVFNL
jgi:hypothetical protein